MLRQRSFRKIIRGCVKYLRKERSIGLTFHRRIKAIQRSLASYVTSKSKRLGSESVLNWNYIGPIMVPILFEKYVFLPFDEIYIGIMK